MEMIHWQFMDRDMSVTKLSDDIAYSWTCNIENHQHTIECLWVWHNCTMELAIEKSKGDHIYPYGSIGWKPARPALHILITQEPLHIETSVHWPECCGMHGWIRDGKYTSV